MKIINCEQGSPEWLAVRAGIPTASELDQILTPKLALRDGKMVDTYCARKLAERWMGKPIETVCTRDMEQGKLLEPDARAWYSMTFDVDIREVGFVLTDDGKFGCSPDGLLPSKGLEIKCPQPVHHIKNLFAGGVPDEYALQCQGGMFATGLSEWEFVSYRRGFPAHIVTMKRDSKAMDAIAAVIASFDERLRIAYDRLLELNGGPSDHDFTTDIDADGTVTRTLKGAMV